MTEPMLTFLGVLVGAVISLVGVLITLWTEREKAKAERKFTAKHEAFLAAGDAVSKFVNYYMTLPDRELPTNGVTDSEVTEMGLALNRLHFYSGLETIQRCMKMAKVLTLALMKAMEAKLPAMFIAEEIKALDLNVSNFEKINAKIDQEILVLIGSNPDSPMILFHRDQLVKNYEKIGQMLERKGSLIKDRYKAVEACRDVVIKDFREVQGAGQDLLLMARKELSFPIDAASYSKLMKVNSDAAMESLENMFKRIRSEVEKRLE